MPDTHTKARRRVNFPSQNSKSEQTRTYLNASDRLTETPSELMQSQSLRCGEKNDRVILQIRFNLVAQMPCGQEIMFSHDALRISGFFDGQPEIKHD